MKWKLARKNGCRLGSSWANESSCWNDHWQNAILYRHKCSFTVISWHYCNYFSLRRPCGVRPKDAKKMIEMLDSRLHLVCYGWLLPPLLWLRWWRASTYLSGSLTSQPSGLPLEHVQTYRRAEHGGSIRTFAILPHQVDPGSLTAGRKWARFMACQMTPLRWLWFSRARFTTENNIDRKYRRGPPELPSF